MGSGRISSAFSKEEETTTEKTESKDIKVSAIPKTHHPFCIGSNPYFYFDSLGGFFPNVESLSNFIDSKDYLGGLEITFNASKPDLQTFQTNDFLLAIQGLLQSIEMEIKSNLTEFEGSDTSKNMFIRFSKDKENQSLQETKNRADGQEAFIYNEPWYIYNAQLGTSEEKFVELVTKTLWDERMKCTAVMIRNERN